jgi:hypothetical protein
MQVGAKEKAMIKAMIKAKAEVEVKEKVEVIGSDALAL